MCVCVCTDRKKTKPFFCLNQNKDLWRMSQELYIYVHYRPFVVAAAAQKTRILIAFCIPFFLSSIPRTILSFPPSNKLHNLNQDLGINQHSSLFDFHPFYIHNCILHFCLSHSYHDAAACSKTSIAWNKNPPLEIRAQSTIFSVTRISEKGGTAEKGGGGRRRRINHYVTNVKQLFFHYWHNVKGMKTNALDKLCKTYFK